MTGSALRFWGQLALAALVLHLVLIQPNHPAAATWRALLLFPLELPVILLALIAARGKLLTALRVVLCTVLGGLAFLKLADFMMFTALARGFNPVSDVMLIEAGLRLLSGSIGLVPAILALLAAGGVFGGLLVALWWASGVWGRISLSSRSTMLATGGAIVLGAVAVADIGHTLGTWRLLASPPGAAFTSRLGYERVVQVRETLADLRAFRAAAQEDPLSTLSGAMDRIDRDVLVVFVESYGRTSLDTPYYADRHRTTLMHHAQALSDLGLSMASGVLGAPTRGGQSWLSHATFANGLWINDQTRYGAVLASGRETLFHIAARSGFHTAAVMPQITLDWPESAVMGFDTILAADDLGYGGVPFNWVTMPDQFTFKALDRLLRDGRHDERLFIQVALGSSHAPWVPVPDLVPWDAIGEGSIFDDMAASGPSPQEIWRDRDKVRAQYRESIDYALRTVFSYAALHAAAPPLMVVLGDHQAADFVSLDERAEVPVHVIGPEHLVARFKGNGFASGLIPPVDSDVLRMDEIRDLMISVFTTELDRKAAGG